MAQATHSLSGKHALALARHRQAVMVLARQAAVRAIKAQLRAQGVKLTQVPGRTIHIFADAWFEAHRRELMAEAEHTIATWPGFAKWRLPDCSNIETDAQKQNEPKSTTSTVQILGAK